MRQPYLDDEAYPPELTRDEALAEQARDKEIVDELLMEREIKAHTAHWHLYLGTPERVA